MSGPTPARSCPTAPTRSAASCEAQCDGGLSARSSSAGGPLGRSAALDVELVAAARDAAGDDVELMIDIGKGWSTVRDGIDRSLRMVEYRPAWIEEPFMPDDYDAYRALAAAVPIPIAAGEEESTLWDFERLIERGGVEVVQPDVTRVGGITECLRGWPSRSPRGRRCIPHAWSTGIIKAATLQVLAAMEAEYFEYCVQTTALNQRLMAERFPVETDLWMCRDAPDSASNSTRPRLAACLRTPGRGRHPLPSSARPQDSWSRSARRCSGSPHPQGSGSRRLGRSSPTWPGPRRMWLSRSRTSACRCAGSARCRMTRLGTASPRSSPAPGSTSTSSRARRALVLACSSSSRAPGRGRPASGTTAPAPRFAACARLEPGALDGAAYAVVSGITPALGERGRRLVGDFVALARELGARVCVDVNYRASCGAPRCAERAGQPSGVRGHRRLQPPRCPARLRRHRRRRRVRPRVRGHMGAGCAVVAVTLGERGSVLASGEDIVEQPAIPRRWSTASAPATRSSPASSGESAAVRASQALRSGRDAGIALNARSSVISPASPRSTS